MAERPQNPRPMVRCAAGFDRDHRRRTRLEESHHILAPQLLTQNHLLGGVHPMKLEKMFRRVHANSANLFHGRSPLFEIATTSFWHNRCRRGPSTPSPDVANDFWQRFDPVDLVTANPRLHSVSPSAFDQRAPGMGVAGLDDAAAPDGLATRSLAGDQAEIGHELARVLRSV